MAFSPVKRYRGGDGKTYEMHSQISAANNLNLATLLGDSTHIRCFHAGTCSWSAAPTYTSNQALAFINSATVSSTAFLDTTDDKPYIRWGTLSQDAGVVASVFTPGPCQYVDAFAGYVHAATAGGDGITSEVRYFFELIDILPIP